MDDEWYDYLQHNFTMFIYFDEEDFHIRVYRTEIQSETRIPWLKRSYEWSHFVYDKELDSVMKSSKETQSRINNNDSTIIHMENFFHQLLQLYSKRDWNDQDKLVLKVGGKSLELFVNEVRQELDSRHNCTFTFNLHYAFILPLDCMQADFEDKIVRPLFTQAHLINSSDHPSRLLVFTELEFLVDNLRSFAQQYQFTDSRIFNARRDFKKKNRYLIARLDTAKENELSWSCHAFEFVELTKCDTQDSISFQLALAPKAINGLPATTKNKFEIGTKVIGALSDILQSKHELKQRPTKDDVGSIACLIFDYFYDKKILDRYIENNNSKKSNNDDTHDEAIQLLDYYNNSISTDNFRTRQKVLLDEEQQMLIKNFSVLEIYNKLFAPIQCYIKKHMEVFTASSDGFINNVNKLYIVPVIKTTNHDYDFDDTYNYNDDNFQTWIAWWISRVLLHYEKSINYKLVIRICHEYEKKVIQGGSLSYSRRRVLYYAKDQLIIRMQHANVMAPPYFLNSKPQEDIVPPEKITILSTTIDKGEEYRLEELLSILQDKFDVNLELKAHYLQVQLYQKHIQLTLKQVVKVAWNEEDATSFVVEERSISIANVYDSFCNRIINCWSLLDNQSCDIHCHQTGSINNNEDNKQQAPSEGALHRKKGFEEGSINLKNHFNKILRPTNGLDLDAKRIVKVSDRCGCRFSLSIRDFIDVALIPTIKQIAAVLSGALVNKQCFGRYKINYIFLLSGDLLLEHNDGATSAFIMEILDAVIQEALEDSNQEKEIQSNCFYCTDNIERLCIKAQQKRLQKNVSKLPIDSSPSLNVTTISSRKGMLRPVSRQRYGFCLTRVDWERLDLLQQIDGTNKLTCVTDVKHSPTIIVEKGQPIPIEGIQKVFYFKVQGNEFFIEIYKIHTPHLQIHSSSGDCSYNLGGGGDSEELIYWNSLYADEKYHIGNRFSSSTKDLLIPIYLSVKYDHPDSYLKISILNGDMDVDPLSRNVDISHPLTLAYF